MICEDLIPIVLCAGLGTRLRPLTHIIPKPAVPLGPWPLGFHAIKSLFELGFSQVHVNTHTLPDLLKGELNAACQAYSNQSGSHVSKRLRFWDEPVLLNTGGGIQNIVWNVWAEDPKNQDKDVLVVSGDIFCDFDWATFCEHWQTLKQQPSIKAVMATLPLALPRSDGVWVDEHGQKIVGFGQKHGDQVQLKHPSAQLRLFSNHQILSHTVFHRPDLNRQDVNSIEKISSVQAFYQRILAQNQTIAHWPLQRPWFNVGEPSDVVACLKAREGPWAGQPIPLLHKAGDHVFLGALKTDPRGLRQAVTRLVRLLQPHWHSLSRLSGPKVLISLSDHRPDHNNKAADGNPLAHPQPLIPCSVLWNFLQYPVLTEESKIMIQQAYEQDTFFFVNAV